MSRQSDVSNVLVALNEDPRNLNPQILLGDSSHIEYAHDIKLAELRTPKRDMKSVVLGSCND